MQIPINEHPKYFSDLKKIIWFRCDISYNPTVNYSRPNLLYIHTNDLEEYFKAADVLTKKIMDCAVENNININWIKSWLIRFGTTDDEIVEQNVFHEKTFDIRTRPRNVTVTTIARFPYDYFLIDNQQWHLYDLTWDYIIIDEASMIPLANIIFPLYKKQPERFYIAGDPHQIEPVIALDLWKDENIYTLVELNDFTTPKTRPHNYEVTKLTTQYRSIIFEFNFYRQK